MGRGSTLNVELWAILHELQVAQIRGFRKVIAKSDCSMAVDMITRCLKGYNSETIVRKIRDNAKLFEEFKIQHVQRKHNMVADYLAKNM